MTLRELPYSVADLFPAADGEFAFHMKFRRGEIAPFYRNCEGNEVLAERRKWLGAEPDRYAMLLPEAAELLAEAIELARDSGVIVEQKKSDLESLVALGGAWEPDLLLMRADSATEQPRLVGGCVCFPSSWALEEKIGRTLDFIHRPVPTLNEQFANPVQQFLARIKPGISWERINWGLSRSPELNQHPARKLARLDGNVPLEEVWFRAEYQSLVALPKSNGVLFGIRLAVEPLAVLRANTEFASGLARAIRTMPEGIAQYKGMATARERLLSFL